MRLFQPLLSSLLVLSFAAAARSQSSCPVASVTTSDFGSSCAHLAIGFDASSCQLVASVTPSSMMSFSFLLIGTSQLSAPMDLPSPPFGSGCSLLVEPVALLPLIGGGITIPPIPQLVGQTVDLQGITLSISLTPPIPPMPPMAPVFLTTQGVQLTFH